MQIITRGTYEKKWNIRYKAMGRGHVIYFWNFWPLPYLENGLN